MSFLSSMDISATGLTAQRLRMDLISQNISNADTVRTEKGTPYRRKIAVFKQGENHKSFSKYLSAANKSNFNINGVQVESIIEDESPLKKVHNPHHPDADQEGYVFMPNVDIMTEMVNMISATRSYEANVASINAAKSMALKALEIGK